MRLLVVLLARSGARMLLALFSLSHVFPDCLCADISASSRSETRLRVIIVQSPSQTKCPLEWLPFLFVTVVPMTEYLSLYHLGFQRWTPYFILLILPEFWLSQINFRSEPPTLFIILVRTLPCHSILSSVQGDSNPLKSRKSRRQK